MLTPSFIKYGTYNGSFNDVFHLLGLCQEDGWIMNLEECGSKRSWPILIRPTIPGSRSPVSGLRTESGTSRIRRSESNYIATFDYRYKRSWHIRGNNHLTTRCTVFLKCSQLHATRRFISLFTPVRHRTVFWATSIHSLFLYHKITLHHYRPIYTYISKVV
jgi:hypothetical protein